MGELAGPSSGGNPAFSPTELFRYLSPGATNQRQEGHESAARPPGALLVRRAATGVDTLDGCVRRLNIGARAAPAPLSPLAALAVKLSSLSRSSSRKTARSLADGGFACSRFARCTWGRTWTRSLATRCRTVRTSPAFKIRNDPRVTPVGRFYDVRASTNCSSFWNVLKGDMSLVGPRPLPCQETLAALAARQRRRLDVTPGLTCTWQATGGLHVSFDHTVDADGHSVCQDALFLGRWKTAIADSMGPRGVLGPLALISGEDFADERQCRTPGGERCLAGLTSAVASLSLPWIILFIAAEMSIWFTTGESFRRGRGDTSNEERADYNVNAVQQGSLPRQIGLLALAGFGAVGLVIPAPRRLRIQGLTGALALAAFLGWAGAQRCLSRMSRSPDVAAP